MDNKFNSQNQEQPLSFEEWKGSVAPAANDTLMNSILRMHGVDYKKEFEEMLKREYQEYLSDFNGNWLLK